MVTNKGLALSERLDPRRFFRGENASEGPVVLSHRRIFILPNRRGMGFALLLSLLLLVAINYNNNLGFVLSFLLASIALLSILYGFRNLAALQVRAGRTEPAFVGDVARFEIHLDNPAHLERYAVQMKLRNVAPLQLDIVPAEGVTVKFEIAADHRGWLELPTLTISTHFPLGLFQSWSPINLKQRALIYPKPADSALPFPERSGEGHRKLEDMDDFQGFQSYQPGDPLRRIYWKGVAKGQGVQVKQYRGDDRSELDLDWTDTPGIDADTRLSRLCRWIIDAEQAGRSYGLRVPGSHIPPGKGATHFRRCLEALALAEI